MSRKFEEGKKFIVYLVINTVNEKQYVGITSRSLEKRQISHFSEAKKNRLQCPFHRAIRKYGTESFIFTHFASCWSWEDACETEKFLIKDMKTKSPFGYNRTDGGEGAYGVIVSEETRQKKRENSTGRKHTEEAKERMRKRRQELWNDPLYRQRSLEGFKKREYTSEYRQRMAEWARTFHTGRKHSVAEKEKRASALRGKKQRLEVVAAKSVRMKIRCADPQHRKNISERMLGTKRSIEFKENCRLRQLGKKHSLLTRQHMSDRHKGKKLSDATRLKMSLVAKSRKISIESRQRMSLAARERVRRERELITNNQLQQGRVA